MLFFYFFQFNLAKNIFVVVNIISKSSHSTASYQFFANVRANHLVHKENNILLQKKLSSVYIVDNFFVKLRLTNLCDLSDLCGFEFIYIYDTNELGRYSIFLQRQFCTYSFRTSSIHQIMPRSYYLEIRSCVNNKDSNLILEQVSMFWQQTYSSTSR